MKKIILISILMSMLLLGCKNNDLLDEQTKVYNGFKESLLNNGDLISSNIPFSYSIDVNEKNGKYIYNVKIYKPEVSMNSIQMLVLNPQDLTNDYVSSSKGIFDEQTYYMVPNQENKTDGYVSSIDLEGVSKDSSFKIYAMVVFKDTNQLTQTQVFFSFNVVDGNNVKEGSMNE